MAGKIPRQFIDDLLARTDIVELIDSKVGLKKAGKDYQACCPFHNEKTLLLPSPKINSFITALVVALMVMLFRLLWNTTN